LTGYIVRRLLASVLLLLGVTFVTFLLFFKVGIDPGRYILGDTRGLQQTEAGQAKLRAMIKRADHELGVDQPVPVQYIRYLQHLAHGSLGKSFTTGQDVRAELVPAARVTAVLVIGGIVLLLAIAVPLGAAAAVRAGSRTDRATLAVTLVGASIPPFLVSVILLLWVAPKVGLTMNSDIPVSPTPQAAPPPGTLRYAGLPLMNQPVVGYCPLLGSSQGCHGVIDWGRHLILPWLAFALGIVALYTRMIRSGVLDLLEEPWVRTARAKGASENRVIRVHVLRAMLAPLLTMLSMDIGMALGTVVYVEAAFRLPGLGNATSQAIIVQDTGFDLPTIAGVVLIAATAVIILNLLADIASAALDPRIRLVGRPGG
jgi:peptide/nickel transport system permease protein